MQVRDNVREFIVSRFLSEDDEMQLSDDDPFFEMGIVDSTGIIELLLFVQEICGFHIPEEDLTPDNFGSITKIVNYTISKKI